jgi:hypothetical protein
VDGEPGWRLSRAACVCVSTWTRVAALLAGNWTAKGMLHNNGPARNRPAVSGTNSKRAGPFQADLILFNSFRPLASDRIGIGKLAGQARPFARSLWAAGDLAVSAHTRK